MADVPVFLVHLRRPNLLDSNERRTDPFFEFGSFGCTGCHSRNLMNPKLVNRLQGARLAFAQGGSEGFRLVLLTPPIDARSFGDRVEARWSPADMPFRYRCAPVLASNGLPSDFKMVERMAASTGRSTIEAGFSSRFRSRTKPLDSETASELVQIFESIRATSRIESIAETYDQTLPYPPPVIDADRESTYDRIVQGLLGTHRSGKCELAHNLPGSKRTKDCR